MNIYDYIDEYGQLTFNEKEFDEIDSAIFSFLSYADLKDVLNKPKITIQELGNIFLKKKSKKDKNIMAVREGNNLLKYIKDTNRYKDCIIFNYEYEGTTEIQFGVISIEYLPNKVYVSFEGTDELISGWKEDLILSYQFPTKSQEKAIKYLNKNYTFSIKELIVAGHSKGGNMALVGGMYTNRFVRNKIKHIYNYDGPGLLIKQFRSKEYERIKNKYTHVIPKYSVVGLFLENSNDYVVQTSSKTILSHNIVYWEINKDKFIKTKLSTFSKKLNKDIDDWLENYSRTDKILFINDLENICKKANVNNLIELITNKTKILELIYNSKDLDITSKKLLLEFINIYVSSFNYSTKEELKKIINNKVRRKEAVK